MRPSGNLFVLTPLPDDMVGCNTRGGKMCVRVFGKPQPENARRGQTPESFACFFATLDTKAPQQFQLYVLAVKIFSAPRRVHAVFSWGLRPAHAVASCLLPGMREKRLEADYPPHPTAEYIRASRRVVIQAVVSHLTHGWGRSPSLLKRTETRRRLLRPTPVYSLLGEMGAPRLLLAAVGVNRECPAVVHPHS